MVQDPTSDLRRVPFCSLNWFIDMFFFIPRRNFFLRLIAYVLFATGIEWRLLVCSLLISRGLWELH